MNAFQALQAGARASKVPSASGTAAGAGPVGRQQDPKAQPWVEKYRPKKVEAVGGQESTTKVLSKALGRADLPHMLFYGPPGTGKTSTILALARELFGPELMKSRVLELNASDERGISVVREKVKNFAKISVSLPSQDYPCPPFKIIILDEADSMTQDAQSALRRIMENYSRTTRFCLICNYVTRIIEPIVSRCSKFRFKPLAPTDTLSRLSHICGAENVLASQPVLEALIKVSDGDLRRAITFLQSASRLHGPAVTQNAGKDDAMDVEKAEISVEEVQEIGGVVPDTVIEGLCVALGVADAQGDTEMGGAGKRGRGEFGEVQKAVESVIRQGFSAWQVLSQLHDRLLLDPLLPARPKATIAMVLGEADKALTDGADEELQVLNVCLKIHAAVKTG